MSTYRSITVLPSVLLGVGGSPVSIGKRVIVGMFFCKGGGYEIHTTK